MQEYPVHRTSTPEWLTNLRCRVKTLAENIFSGPYLPVKFIIFFLITNTTHMAVILMNQPLNYWYRDLNAKGIESTGSPTDMSPGDWVVFGIVYLAIALFCLTVFNYRWSLIGWLTAEVVHFYGIHNWLEGCSFSRWSVQMGSLCRSFDGRLYWIFCGLIVGLFLTSLLDRSPFTFSNKRVEKGLSRACVLLTAAWVVILVSGVAFSIQKPGTYGWVPVEIEHKPGPLYQAEVARDMKNNELVLFGGMSGALEDGLFDYKAGTWVWDGIRWLNMYPAISPSGRVKHAMAYDENREMVVMFGGFGSGGILHDTWEWDGYTWANHCTCTHPSARYGHEMFYDPARKKVVLYGGYDKETEFKDAWEWDGEGCMWNKIELGENPPPASYFSLVFDPVEDHMLGLLSGSSHGTWVFEKNTWTKLSTGTQPRERVRTTLIYDPIRRVFVLFGGESQDTILNDTWIFDGTNWTQNLTGFQPSSRSDMVQWYDPVRKHVMLYGGNYRGTVFDDMWEFVPAP